MSMEEGYFNAAIPDLEFVFHIFNGTPSLKWNFVMNGLEMVFKVETPGSHECHTAVMNS